MKGFERLSAANNLRAAADSGLGATPCHGHARSPHLFGPPRPLRAQHAMERPPEQTLLYLARLPRTGSGAARKNAERLRTSTVVCSHGPFGHPGQALWRCEVGLEQKNNVKQFFNVNVF